MLELEVEWEREEAPERQGRREYRKGTDERKGRLYTVRTIHDLRQ